MRACYTLNTLLDLIPVDKILGSGEQGIIAVEVSDLNPAGRISMQYHKM
jgi:hypothetical protein